MPAHYPLSQLPLLCSDTWLPLASAGSRIVPGLNSSVQSESLEFTPGLGGGLFLCWGQSVASQSLMELKMCLGRIVLEVILKVRVPQTLLAGRRGRREVYLRDLRILALFFLAHMRSIRFLIFRRS